MTSRETVRAQLAALRQENDRLTEELRALQKRKSTGEVDEVNLPPADESATLLAVHKQACEDLQAELAETQERCHKLDQACCEVQAQLQRERQEAELECLRAVETERGKWEAREERLVQQLRELQSRLSEKNKGKL